MIFENTCTLSFYHHQIGSMTHFPLFMKQRFVLHVVLYYYRSSEGSLRVVKRWSTSYLIRMTWEWKRVSSGWHNEFAVSSGCHNEFVVTHTDEIPSFAMSIERLKMIWHVIRMTQFICHPYAILPRSTLSRWLMVASYVIWMAYCIGYRSSGCDITFSWAIRTS